MDKTQSFPYPIIAIFSIILIFIIFYYAISKKMSQKEQGESTAPPLDPYAPDRFDENCKTVEPVISETATRSIPNNNEDSLLDDFYKGMTKEELREYINFELNAKKRNEISAQLEKYFIQIHRQLKVGNIERAFILFLESINIANPIEFAIDRHFYIIQILEEFYAMRDYDSIALQYCLAICDEDIKNGDNLIKKMNSDTFDMVSPTRKAIILERNMDYTGAIEVCEWALERDLLDSGKKSFIGRKARLEKKLQNQLQY